LQNFPEKTCVIAKNRSNFEKSFRNLHEKCYKDTYF
jgi:hypothetical protein